jgi:hypothetical protein
MPSSLLGDGVRVFTSTMKKIAKIHGAAVTRLRVNPRCSITITESCGPPGGTCFAARRSLLLALIR